MMRDRKIEIKMPWLEAEAGIIEVVNWLVAEGEVIDIDQDILELSVNGEPFFLPSPLDGRLIGLLVEPGELLETGQVIGVVQIID